MKKLMILFVALLSISTAFAQDDHPSFSIGAGFILGSKAGIDEDYSSKIGAGFNIHLSIELSEKFFLSPGFIRYFPDAGEGINMVYWQLNTNLHYYFESNIYTIYGLSYNHTEGIIDGGEIGANIGLGYKMGVPVFELNYDTAFDQITFSMIFSFTLPTTRGR